MLKLNARVTVLRDIDLLPITIVRRGEKGRVAFIEYNELGEIHSVEIKLNRYHKGLDAWNNEAHLTGPELINTLRVTHLGSWLPLVALGAMLLLGPLACLRWLSRLKVCMLT